MSIAESGRRAALLLVADVADASPILCSPCTLDPVADCDEFFLDVDAEDDSDFGRVVSRHFSRNGCMLRTLRAIIDAANQRYKRAHRGIVSPLNGPGSLPAHASKERSLLPARERARVLIALTHARHIVIAM